MIEPTPQKSTRNAYVKWSMESEKMLVELYQANASIREMVVALNRPSANIRAKLSRLGLKLSERNSAPNREAFDAIMQARGLPARYEVE